MKRCLNRTSVGLKRHRAMLGDGHTKEPQSNQRGIETFVEISADLSGLSLNRTSVGLKR